MITLKILTLLLTLNDPQKQLGTRKGKGGKGGQRNRKLLHFFLLGTVFLSKNGLTLKLLLAMGPAIRTHICSHHTATYVFHQHTGHNLLQKQMRSKNTLLSKQVVSVCVCVCSRVWFMQKSCQNILVYQKSNLHTFLGHCRGWLTWRITIQKECWLKHFRSLGCKSTT